MQLHKRWIVRVENEDGMMSSNIFSFPIPIIKEQVLLSSVVKEWIGERVVDNIRVWDNL